RERAARALEQSSERRAQSRRHLDCRRRRRKVEDSAVDIEKKCGRIDSRCRKLHWARGARVGTVCQRQFHYFLAKSCGSQTSNAPATFKFSVRTTPRAIERKVKPCPPKLRFSSPTSAARKHGLRSAVAGG